MGDHREDRPAAKPRDIGDELWVPPEERLDVDDDESTHAKTGGLDDEDLDEFRHNFPGEVVPAERLI